MASTDPKKELECSVCLNFYTDPVTLKCGHDFCQDCIGHVLDTQEESGGYSCPECREEFLERPELQRNTTLSNKVENFVSTLPAQEYSGIFTYYVDTPIPAVILDVQYKASLVDNQLRLSRKSPERVSCDPTTSPENKKCSVHKKLLEYYCIEDSAFICASCSMAEEHQGHQVETLDKASKVKKRRLRKVLQKMLTEKEEIEKRVESLQEHGRKVQGKADDETKRVTVLFRNLRRRLDDLEKRVQSEISGQAERVSLSLSDMIQHLEIMDDDLSSKMADIEELCHLTDPLAVLKDLGTGDLCDTEDGDDLDRERHDLLLHNRVDLDMAGISQTLHTGLSDIMSWVNVQKYTDTHVYPHSTAQDKDHINAKPFRKRPQPYPTIQRSHCQAGGQNIGAAQPTSGVWRVTDLLLDVGTACNLLHISDDRKTVSWSSNQNRPETPERFHWPQVMSIQSFSSGRNYWEVDVGGSLYWRVGMCYPSIDRKGDECLIGCNKKSWGLRRFNNQYSVIHERKKIRLSGSVSSNRVRICLDYEAGQISFYELCDPVRHLHTFTTTFTEPLHAGLRVGLGSCIRISEANQM
ncbi:E3 ubiquitin-protein ligase TRIM39-like [Rana temporaria]|uniref:E3 ubiquitin-protein ligase TRIM39-like n=1 Tax=Rana temporaria TaxID=8407 RepID=UPI001AACFC50|nr:E3 ubiquitin-protein ligase TRIM39-like [Rana temporaria]